MKSNLPQPIQHTRTTSVLVSRVVTVQNLTAFGTRLDVPADQVAVWVGSSGCVRLLGPGKHKVRSASFQRLPLIGLISKVAFRLSAHVAGILAGGANGELLDGEVRYGLQVAEAALFFERVGQGQSELRAWDLAHWLEPKIQAALEPLVSQYAVTDLIGDGLAAEKLLGRLREQVAVRLAEFGLALEWIQKPTFCRAENVVPRIRRIQELRQKLRKIELDDKMDQAQKQAELEDFRRQLDAESGTQGKAEATQPGRYFPPFRGDYASQITAADLQRADSLLRDQAGGELTRLLETVREACSWIYRGGNTELALRLKYLQRQIETLTDELMGAQPVYLSIPDLPRAELKSALAQEGKILDYAQMLDDEAQTALAETLAGQENAPRWAEIEAKLAALRHQFAMRSRLPQPEARAHF